MNAAHQRRLTPALGGSAVVLAALLLLLFGGVGRAVHWLPPRTLPPLPPPGTSANLPQPELLQRFSVVWNKPLFNPDRKPTTRAAAGASNLGDLELTGIIITPELRMALLHDKNGNKEIRLREGATLPDGSVTLIEVHARSAVFDSAAGRTELKLPAGALIDQAADGADNDREQSPTPGQATMRIQNDGAGQPKLDAGRSSRRARQVPSAQADDSPPSTLERLRRTIEKRREARAAASHEGEH